MSDYFCDPIMPVKILVDVFQPSQCRIFSIVLISFFFKFYRYCQISVIRENSNTKYSVEAHGIIAINQK